MIKDSKNSKFCIGHGTNHDDRANNYANTVIPL